MEDKGGLLEVGDAVRYSTSGKEFRCLVTPTIVVVGIERGILSGAGYSLGGEG